MIRVMLSYDTAKEEKFSVGYDDYEYLVLDTPTGMYYITTEDAKQLSGMLRYFAEGNGKYEDMPSVPSTIPDPTRAVPTRF